jgi:DNA-binding IclR family transcriptional regulator
VSDTDREAEPRYRAPALEKGLDILELVTRATRPMTVAMMTQELGRSTGELFRMIQVLEHRGYIEQQDAGRYVATTKIFALGMAQAPVKTLLEAALPVMRRLAGDTAQSCHLATRSGGDIVVIARMESPGLIGFSVRLGYRQPIAATGSGSVLYAFQPESARRLWEADFDPAMSPTELDRFRRHADQVAHQGFDQHPSGFVPGILDLSAPVLRGNVATAALTMPFVMRNPLPVDVDAALTLLRDAATEISAELASSDVRV